jgi:hypothetical protein
MAVERLTLENDSLKRENAMLRRMATCDVNREDNPCKKAHLSVRLGELREPIPEKFGSLRTHTGMFTIATDDEAFITGRVSRRVKNGVANFSVFSVQATQAFKRVLSCKCDPPAQRGKIRVNVTEHTSAASLPCSRVITTG